MDRYWLVLLAILIPKCSLLLVDIVGHSLIKVWTVTGWYCSPFSYQSMDRYRQGFLAILLSKHGPLVVVNIGPFHVKVGTVIGCYCYCRS